MTAADVQLILMFLLAFIVAITLHEFGHAIVADRLGDDTPRLQGRITLNPLDHLDPIGTIVLIITSISGFSFGWGKPVFVVKSRFKNPRSGDLLVSLAGPMMNLILGAVCAVMVRTGYFGLPNSSPWHQFIDIALNVNLMLFVFNLIPIPPLDGSHILADLLPEEMSKRYVAAMARWGWLLFFILLAFGGRVIGPEVAQIRYWLIPE